MMEYQVSKASTVSIYTAFIRHQLSIDIFFGLLPVKYDIKIQNAGDKSLHSKSRTQCLSKEEIFFLAVCLSKRYTKVPEVVLAPSL